MLVIIHFFVSISGNVPISSSEIEKIKITFSNSDVLSSHHANFAYTAGALAASVPFLAYFITKGLSFVLNNAAQHFGGIAQSLSVGEAQSAATGNVSMASYSGWNMNYDNTNAHKFDTNRTHFEGMSSQQMPNGAISTDTQDGSHIANVLPAISNSAVSVHGSDRVVDALHQSANESFNTASQLRTSADTHAQEGLNQLKNFSENDSNDYRSGAGVSNTTTDSINQDLRNMKDAVHAYNKHHDVSSQTSVEAAAAYRLNTNKAIWGKGVELATGSSIDASVTGRTQGSTTHSAQWFNNSSEGQAFNESFNHMMNTARHNNLDTTDNHNLSGSEQIAANFATSESLLKQSSSEYSHGMQLQNAASHAKEQSSSIDDNLNQPFHDWALQHHPESGKQVMLGTDLESIRTQHQWANEFLDSSTGKSLINNQVHAALERSASSLKADYQSNAAELENTSHIHQKYAKDSDAVDMQADKSKLERINPVQMESLQSLHREQQSKTIEADAKKTADYVNLRLDDVDKKIEHLPLNKEK
jgi:conjugal transfer mating pair stabilization protein TraG